MIKNRLFLLWYLTGATCLVIIAVLLPWRFQVNDDVIMMWLVSGAYTGTPEPYAVFIHPILSWGFSKLYTIFPHSYWYEGVWFICIYMAFSLLIHRISKFTASSSTKNLLAFFILLISLHFGIFPQFTLVAGFSTFTALIILTSEESNLSKGLAFFLLTFGIMIRWEAAILISLGFASYFLFSYRRMSYRLDKNIFGVILLFLGLIGSKSIYEMSSPYADFLKFNRIRAGVIDHPVFHQEVLGKAIPEHSEMYFFSRWYFEDSGISEADLHEKKRSLDSKLFTMDQVEESLVRLWRFQRVEAFKSALILGILILVFLTCRRTPYLIFFVSSWILFLLIFNHFFLIQGRVIFLFFLCILIPLFTIGQIQIRRKAALVLILVYLIAFAFHFSNFLKEGRGRKIMDQELLSLQTRLIPSVAMIIEGYHEHNLGFNFSSSNPVPFLSTGWISRSEFQKKALKRMNLSSFDDIEEYALITPITNTEIVFPDYMDHAFGSFVQIDSTRSANFILLQFKKR